MEVLLSNASRASPGDGAAAGSAASASASSVAASSAAGASAARAATDSTVGALSAGAAADWPPPGWIASSSRAFGGTSRRPAAGSARFVKQSRASRPDSEGWQKFRSGRQYLDHRRCTHPRRRVPADLVGKCINCFSATHTLARCRLQVRCFRCRSMGHQSYVCPAMVRGGCASQLERRSVWRRISPAQEPVVTAQEPALMVGLASGVDTGVRVIVGARMVATQAHPQQLPPC